MSKRSDIPGIQDIQGVVLAGGKSSRFGRNKAMAVFQGASFLKRTLAVMDALFEETAIVTNTPEVYEACYGGDGGGRHPVWQDITPYAGPMGGIVTAFEKSRHDRIFVVACDMPLLDVTVLREIIRDSDDADAVIPCHGDTKEYLMALYRRNLLPDLKKSLEAGQHSLKNFLKNRAKVRCVSVEGRSWLNVNTPEDFEYLETSHALG